MEQQDKERLFVLLGNFVLTVVCLTTLILFSALGGDIPAVFIAYIISLICLILACVFVSTAGGKTGILILSKILSWAGTLGLAAAGILIALSIMGY